MNTQVAEKIGYSRILNIGVVGLDSNDLDLVELVANTGLANSCQYKINQLSKASMERVGGMDLYIVGNNDPMSVIVWQRSVRKLADENALPIIRVVEKGQTSVANGYFLNSPMDFRSVYDLLQQYTAREVIKISDDLCEDRVVEIGLKQAAVKLVKTGSEAKRRMLVISERDSAYRFIDQHLAEEGVKCDYFMDSSATLAAAEKYRYQAIWIYTENSTLDSIDLCQKLREVYFNRITPIVLINRDLSFIDQLRAKFCGSTTVIRKPLDQVKVDQVVNKLSSSS